MCKIVFLPHRQDNSYSRNCGSMNPGYLTGAVLPSPIYSLVCVLSPPRNKKVTKSFYSHFHSVLARFFLLVSDLQGTPVIIELAIHSALAFNLTPHNHHGQ